MCSVYTSIQALGGWIRCRMPSFIAPSYPVQTELAVPFILSLVQLPNLESCSP